MGEGLEVFPLCLCVLLGLCLCTDSTHYEGIGVVALACPSQHV